MYRMSEQRKEVDQVYSQVAAVVGNGAEEAVDDSLAVLHSMLAVLTINMLVLT